MEARGREKRKREATALSIVFERRGECAASAGAVKSVEGSLFKSNLAEGRSVREEGVRSREESLVGGAAA